jgi:excisionase family DNA binding protein
MFKVNGREVASIPQACELVGVSRRTIYYWMSKGYVETTRTASGLRRIFVDTLYRSENDRDKARAAKCTDAYKIGQEKKQIQS